MSDSPGWDAISQACERVYPDQPEPLRFGTVIKYRLGGPDPIDGVSIYRSVRPAAHWHYVTYGFSDLYDPEPLAETVDADGDPVGSGYGFEMTFRLLDPQAADPSVQPPIWPINLIQNLARYVFSTGNVFAAGHHIDANGPIAADRQTALTALAFWPDPDLGAIDTPRGHVDFIQAVGVTHDELEAMREWNTMSFLELLDRRYPKLITMLQRGSALADPATRATVEEGKAAEGSSQGSLLVEHVRIDHSASPVVCEIGNMVAGELLAALAGRIPYGKSLFVESQDDSIVFRSGDAPGVSKLGDNDLLCTLDQATLAAFSALRGEPGEYRVPGLDVIWRVVSER